MKWKIVSRLLDDCEQGLRKLVAEAAEEGDYSSVLRIADLAKAVSALAAESRSFPAVSTTPPTPIPAAASVPKAPIANHTSSAGAASAGGRRQSHSADAYPKFSRRGDELVKTGWSKMDQKEYNHRASRAVINAVAGAIRQIGAQGRLFHGDAMLPLKDPTDGSLIPDYQAYVALAWLKDLALVEQHGRRAGYTLAHEKQIDSTITAAWRDLPEWRG
jgi:hypothetical protein